MISPSFSWKNVFLIALFVVSWQVILTVVLVWATFASTIVK